MRRISFVYLLILGSFSSVFAAASEEEATPQELTARYMKVLGHTQPIPKITTPKAGFNYIVKSITQLSGQPHTHVESGPQYGFSFVHKNMAPIDYVTGLVTGKKTWKQSDILATPIRIADIGCGIGFSAAYFISEVIKFYSSEPGWVLQSPIKLDLYDITPEHQNALRPLAALVNAAYPEYFHLETFTHDGKNAFPENRYKIVFAFNLLHYIPEPDWSRVIQNIENTLEKSGMFFVTTDHYHVGTSSLERAQRFETAARKRVESSSLSPFVFPMIGLVNPKFGEQFQTRTLNSSLDPFLKDLAQYGPGDRVKAEDINWEALTLILRRHAQEQKKSTPVIGLYNGEKLFDTPIEEIITLLKEGRLFAQLSALGFDENLLEKAIIMNSRRNLARLKISSWPKNLPANQHGYPSTVGLTFTKK